MLSLQEAMQLDFAGGAGSWQDVDLASPFGFEEFGFFDVDDGSCSAVSAPETCTPPPPPPPPLPLGDAALAGEREVAEEDEDEERRMRRKASNRESARRSRARKRRREEELENALEALRGENRALAVRLHAAARRALATRGYTARLHAEAGALRRRLSEAQRSAVVMLAMSRLLRTTSSTPGIHDGAMRGGRVSSATPAVPPQPARGLASSFMR